MAHPHRTPSPHQGPPTQNRRWPCNHQTHRCQQPIPVPRLTTTRRLPPRLTNSLPSTRRLGHHPLRFRTANMRSTPALLVRHHPLPLLPSTMASPHRLPLMPSRHRQIQTCRWRRARRLHRRALAPPPRSTGHSRQVRRLGQGRGPKMRWRRRVSTRRLRRLTITRKGITSS